MEKVQALLKNEETHITVFFFICHLQNGRP